MRGLRTVCWDSCVFYAWLKNEVDSYGPEAIDRIAEVAHEIEAGRIKLVVSTMVQVEAYAGKIGEDSKQKLDQFLARKPVERVAPDVRITELAERIRNESLKEFGTAVGGPDSVHLATALSRQVDEFHTMEGRKNKNKSLALKKLDGHRIIRGMPIKAPRLPSTGKDDLFHVED